MADQHRLPTSVVPSHYQLSLTSDLEAATFAGTEAVTVEVKEATTEVVLNALELEIGEAWFEAAGGAR